MPGRKVEKRDESKKKLGERDRAKTIWQ